LHIALPKFSKAELNAGIFMLALVAIYFAVYNETVSTLVKTLADSETYSHGLLVPFASAFLAWKIGRTTSPGPQPKTTLAIILGISIVCIFGLMWLASQSAGLNVGTQVALLFMFYGLVIGVFGLAAVKRFWFPLMFLVFIIPFGDVFEATLMVWTADATVWLLRLSGFAVFRDGLHFQLPSGRWSVVEACSGMRYLLAALPLGCIFAYFNYTSIKKRTLFMVACVIVPVVANWLRAYMIVLIGHYSGMTLAVGVDHLIYGWFFFGLVIAFLFWMGGKWADPPTSLPTSSPGAQVTESIGQSSTGLATYLPRAALLLALCVAWPLLGSWIERSIPQVANTSEFASKINASKAPGRYGFNPSFTGFQEMQNGAIPDSNVDFFAALYSKQKKNGELISWQNKIVHSEGSNWHETASRVQSSGTGGTPTQASGSGIKVNETELRNADGRLLLVWSVYALGHNTYADARAAKLISAYRAISERRDDSYFLEVHTLVGKGGVPAARTELTSGLDSLMKDFRAFTPSFSQ
jgi:exosortase A